MQKTERSPPHGFLFTIHDSENVSGTLKYLMANLLHSTSSFLRWKQNATFMNANVWTGCRSWIGVQLELRRLGSKLLVVYMDFCLFTENELLG